MSKFVSRVALLALSLNLFVPAAAPQATTLTSVLAAPTARPIKTVGRLPALGWNTFNAFKSHFNEEKILDAANSFVSLGLKDAGYEYVNIDDSWSDFTGRDPSTNRMKPNFTRFPDGIDGTAAKVHALGLKIGIYSDAGTLTCDKYPGSLEYEMIDAQTFSDWGIDYLKYDNCHVPSNWTDDPNPPSDFDWYNSNTAMRYRRMTAALDSVPRPILFALCEWGKANVWTWGARVGHSWRMTGDAKPTWQFISSTIDKNAKYLNYVGYYSHNDMDMMEIGNGNLTIEEQRTHFASWAFMKSPILLGTTLSKLSADLLTIIKNPELLAFHQDGDFGAPAFPYSNGTSPPEYYSGKSGKGTHIFVINTSNSTETKKIDFSVAPGLGSGRWKVHDMWSSKDLGTFESSYSFSLASHDTGAFLITKN